MISIITEKSELPALKDEWDHLADIMYTPLLSFDWFMACIETINKHDDIKIVTIRDNGKLTAIAPLCLKTSPILSLEIIGTSTLYEPSDLLYVDSDNLSLLTQAIVDLKYPIILLRIPNGNSGKIICNTLSYTRSIHFKRNTSPSAYIDINSDWQSFLDQLSSNRRYDFRRKRKRLSKKGKLRIDIVNPSTNNLDSSLNNAFVVENNSWKGENNSSLLKNDSLRSFFCNYTKKANINDSLRVCFIYVDENAISMHIAIVSHNRFWVLKLGYDDKLSNCSPGSQLAMDTIEYSFSNKFDGYEFLGSKENWQNAWPIKEHSFCAILIFPYSISGMKGLFQTVLSIMLSKVKRTFDF